MRFRSYDTLRMFMTVADAGGFTAAADRLNLTKGAVSYRIKRLEEELGFPVFDRLHREVALTPKGRELLRITEAAFRDLDRDIAALQEDDSDDITIATSTYFASRWLSPRLMTFMAAHPNIGLHLQPLVNLMDLRNSGADVVIRWGDGRWTDRESELLFPCPSFPTAGGALAERIAKTGLRAVFAEVPLLHDRDDSTAWEDWSRAAGLPYTPKRNPLVIPDPNVRVQAVIDGHQETLEGGAESALRILKAGGRLGMGGDYGFAWNPHGTYAKELSFFVDYVGFSAVDTIKCATKTGAEIMGREEEFGTIEAGKLADVLVVDADLESDMAALETPENFIAVIQGGVVKAGRLAAHQPAIRGTVQ